VQRYGSNSKTRVEGHTIGCFRRGKRPFQIYRNSSSRFTKHRESKKRSSLDYNGETLISHHYAEMRPAHRVSLLLLFQNFHSRPFDSHSGPGHSLVHLQEQTPHPTTVRRVQELQLQLLVNTPPQVTPDPKQGRPMCMLQSLSNASGDGMTMRSTKQPIAQVPLRLFLFVNRVRTRTHPLETPTTETTTTAHRGKSLDSDNKRRDTSDRKKISKARTRIIQLVTANRNHRVYIISSLFPFRKYLAQKNDYVIALRYIYISFLCSVA
jgi:hypothetical protein